jgi:multidrug efflux pump subunit AcrB
MNHKAYLLAGIGIALLAVATRLSADTPAIVVEANYPGANATVVADVVADPRRGEGVLSAITVHQ